ncbi:hypothetical protein Tsubulata_038323 [Turnera subulata]|uniref:Exonuclease domain-containing protein n=1 Tax=Turnera subulata TaxID=218843 RepID=A0A9Q0JD03_9ROSI|nr:hypothetical protein Tsubulata_038323 [Turnera subulata]
MVMEASYSCQVEAATTPIVFFDMETTVPNRAGQRFWVLEFGAIVICPRKLIELESYSTLIRPTDMSAVASRSGRSEGITRDAVAHAPTMEEVADKIFSLLNGRIWAGHNIRRFDCVRIKEAFADIGRPAPVPLAMIDSLGVLGQKFGSRAGNMKMATLAAYFGLGQQKHRSLDDVRMNLEVLKHCATVLFLVIFFTPYPFPFYRIIEFQESSLPSVLNGKWQNSSSMITRSRSKGKLGCREETSRKSPPTTLGCQRAVPYARRNTWGKMTGVKDLLSKAQQTKPFNQLLIHTRSMLK